MLSSLGCQVVTHQAMITVTDHLLCSIYVLVILYISLCFYIVIQKKNKLKLKLKLYS